MGAHLNRKKEKFLFTESISVGDIAGSKHPPHEHNDYNDLSMSHTVLKKRKR